MCFEFRVQAVCESPSHAHGVAHVTSEDRESKVRAVATLNRLYQVRNPVAHGRRRHVDESDLWVMRLAVQQVVRAIAPGAQQFSPKVRLQQWIKDQDPFRSCTPAEISSRPFHML
jgi:hypothetical protein